MRGFRGTAAVAAAAAASLLFAASAAANNAPQASFDYAPSRPAAGQQVTFTSTSSDSDGTIIRSSWDLDDDGAFDDASGTTATHTFNAAGSYTVRLQVADNGGASAVATKAVVVAAAPPPEPPGTGAGLITFEEVPAGTVVHSDYKSQGIELGFTQNDPLGKSGEFPVVVADGGARSDGQIARTALCGQEFCSNTIYGRFGSARGHVEVFAGGGKKVALIGLNAFGKVVATDSKVTGASVATKLAIDAPAHNIAFIQIGEDAPLGAQYGVVKLDDLGFDAAAPHSGPDFGLSWLPQFPGGSLGVSKGSTDVTSIQVIRLGGSSGPISFSVDPASLPKGVTASFSPPAPGESVPSVALTVKAAANAETVGPDKKLKVIGHPTSAAAGAADRSIQIPLTVQLSNYDVVTTGMEITQGIQQQETPYYTDAGALSPSICKKSPSLPVRDMADPSKPVAYQTFTEEPLFPQSPLSETFGVDVVGSTITRRHGGVELARDRTTVVRVFASLTTPANASLPDVPAVLYGSRGGKPLPGSPLSPAEGPRKLKYSGYPWVTCANRANPRGAYTFTLPQSWVEGTVKLRAEALPQQQLFGPGGECGTSTCLANNALTYTDVEFTPTAYMTVTPVQMSYSDFSTNSQVDPPLPGKVFAEVRNMLPSRLEYGSGASDYGYAGVVSLDDVVFDSDLTASERCLAAINVIEDWGDDHPHGDETVGVFAHESPVCAGGSDAGYHLRSEHEAFSVVTAERPYTSVAHEMFHGIGRKHASSACNATGPQAGEPWPPDEQGQIEGIGLDTRAGSGGLAGVYRPIVPGDLGVSGKGLFAVATSPKWFDFMSYCADNSAPETNSWVSDRGWNDTLNSLYRFQQDMGRTSKAAAAQVQAPTLRVLGFADDRGTRVALVKPGTGKPVPADPASPYRLVIKDAAGAVVSNTPMVAGVSHVDGGTADAGPIVPLTGEGPAAGAASVEIVRDGAVAASRTRSLNAPAVGVVSPRAGATVGRPGHVDLRWTASDADGDKLRAKVDYSGDDGRHWGTIFAGPSSGGVRVPARMLAASRRARIRVRVNDGFNETAAVSARFVSLGAGPDVSIRAPAKGQKLAGDSAAYLEGEAYDDAGRLLDGRRATWFAGRRRLGRGLHISVKLPPGRRTLRLVAVDGHGRRGSASVRVRVTTAKPHILGLRTPKRLSRRAKALRFRIATTDAARLTVGARRVAVGRRLKTVRIGIRPGRKRLRVRLRLSAHGRSSSTTLVIERR